MTYHLIVEGRPACGSRTVVSLEPEGFCTACRELSRADRPAPVAVSVTIVSEVDEGWIHHVTGGEEGDADVFMRGYSGYWLFGCEHEPDKGWLAYDQEALGKRPADDEYVAAVWAWRAGEELPEHWFRLNATTAKFGWAAGVRRWGERWFAEGDGDRYDWALQMALFGEARYG